MEMESNFISLFHRLLKALQYQGPHRCSGRHLISSWIFQPRILLHLCPATLQLCHWKMISSHLDSDIIINIPLLIISNCLFDFFFFMKPFPGYSKPFQISVHTDGAESSSSPAETNNRGFCFNYVQQPCNSSTG